MKKIIAILGFVLVLAGCSDSPVYYTEREVKNIVQNTFGREYKLVAKKEYLDDSEEKNKAYEYVFENKKEDFEFSVYSETKKTPLFATAEAEYYSEHLSSNFVEQQIKLKEKKLEKLLSDSGFKYDIKAIYGYIELGVNDYNDFSEISSIIEEIDETLDLDIRTGENMLYGSAYHPVKIDILMKPNANYSENWFNTCSGCSVSVVHVSNSEKTRLKKQDIYNEIEEEFVREVRGYNKYEYVASEEMEMKYPHETIDDVFVKNGIDSIPMEIDATFEYELEQEFYYAFGPYSWGEDFENIVVALGGTYELTSRSIDEKTVSWGIGSNSWRLEFNRNEDDEQVLYKNGKKISDIEKKYSENHGELILYDLEAYEILLNVDIQLDKYKGTMEIINLN